MKGNLIAVNGVIGSGKDTFAQVFTENGYVKMSFATALKDAVSAIFGWDRIMLEGLTEESRNFRETPDQYWTDKLGFRVTPRWVLQNFGTDIVRRHLDDNMWVYALEKKLYDALNHGINVIITDCRFINELNMIRSNNGMIVEVQRNVPAWYHEAKHYNLKLQTYELTLNNQLTVSPELPVLPSVLQNIHVSEYSWIGINNPHYVVHNNSTVESLQEKALQILQGQKRP